MSTLASTAYTHLRAELISGVIPPGSRMLIRPLCERLGIGLSPTREALNRLSSEGLVQQADQRGFTAAPLDMHDLADLTLARATVNAAALRDAVAHGDAAWEAAILLSHDELTGAELTGAAGGAAPAAGLEALHRAFHAALISACRSSRLRGFCAQLFDAADRYRIILRAKVESGRDGAAEHLAIMQATLARDAEQAVALLEAHVRLTDRLVRAALG